ncbi:Putative transmembrane protein (PGPGW) [Planifilum fulgidum]|jgi:uncharacterized membrane protein YbaN (DUF454 family)|uniref:Putative transmembrane protein (PGPGW) n=1 Tax=Planifilum fulgidum TaxID=201973 RepID=A0A1I2KPT8_9BACL|nr:PGPGW domain-containing protein [Planifilum fulgidum]MBO2495621.1 hypothetical protein [Bacillota bacterium]MBO2533745.1 hypothetical protein [Thermoactinomycetaceae bacterium]SFF67121.1 Putative transmembrane protein (PGPGW) [Planifilum fulgidum]
MRERAKRIWTMTLGFLFLLLGIAGLFLPFLQGILFLLIGLYLLSKTSRLAKKLLLRLQTRFPRFARQLDRFTARGFKR